MLERAEKLQKSADLERIRPFIHLFGEHDVVKAELVGGISRSTFYRTIKKLTDESEDIRCRLMQICDLEQKKCA